MKRETGGAPQESRLARLPARLSSEQKQAVGQSLANHCTGADHRRERSLDAADGPLGSARREPPIEDSGRSIRSLRLAREIGEDRSADRIDVHVVFGLRPPAFVRVAGIVLDQESLPARRLAVTPRTLRNRGAGRPQATNTRVSRSLAFEAGRVRPTTSGRDDERAPKAPGRTLGRCSPRLRVASDPARRAKIALARSRFGRE